MTSRLSKRLSYKAAAELPRNRLERKVEKAKRDEKIFILTLWDYIHVKESLEKRGWLEKVIDSQMPFVKRWTERHIIARMLKNVPADLIWQPKFGLIQRNSKRPALMNSLHMDRMYNFTYKDGLKVCAEAIGWYHIEDVAEQCYLPRTHVLSDQSAKAKFREDYRDTAFTSFISFLDSQEDLSKLFAQNGTLSTDCIEFAIIKIKLMVRLEEHVDIDMPRVFDTCYKRPKNQNLVLFQIEQIINGLKKFKIQTDEIIEFWKKKIRKCAEEIEYHWPHLKYDGYNNIWIFKPPDLLQGNGIIVENDEQKIEEILTNLNKVYVAQKYIERPLLIHNRKFDMRIYMLTIILNRTVHIWLYKDCYIKFSSLPFNLQNFHRSIHLTNYGVQKYYLNSSNAVPNSVDGMWKLKQLLDYFKSSGYPDVWESKIYPELKKGLLAVVIPALEWTNIQHKGFELYGADVMITYDFEPALIEINYNPQLYGWQHQESVITAQLLEDVIKVVVDHTRNNRASTGHFEHIFSKEIPDIDFEMKNLEIIGENIQLHPISKTKVLNDTEVKIKDAIQSY